MAGQDCRRGTNRRPGAIPGGGSIWRRREATPRPATRARLLFATLVGAAACDEPAAPRVDATWLERPPEPIELAQGSTFARPGDTIDVWVQRATLPPDAWLRWIVHGEVAQTSGTHLRVAAGAAPDTIAIVVEAGVDGMTGADTVRVVVAEQFVVLKVDDLGLGSPDPLSDGWRWFVDYIEDHDLYAALGLVARSLETGGPGYLAAARRLAGSRHFEIWNHGYDHTLGATGPDGNVYSEFRGASFEHQLDHLRRAQRLALDSLGVVMRSFGAPGNAVDSATTRALAQVPELDVWLFGRFDSDLLVLDRIVEGESRPGTASYDRFLETYDPAAPIVTLQLHPGFWSRESVADFVRIVAHLKARGAAFVLPAAYADYVAGTPQ